MAIDALLDALPSMFSQTKQPVVDTCTGPALNAAKRIIQHIGGKLLLFQSSLPTIGEGTLKPRDNPRLLGTDKEHMLLNAEEAWYKNSAVDFSRLQVSGGARAVWKRVEEGGRGWCLGNVCRMLTMEGGEGRGEGRGVGG